MSIKTSKPTITIVRSNTVLSGIVDLIVIGTSFLFACSLLSVALQTEVLTVALVYSVVVPAAVRLSKLFLSTIPNTFGAIYTSGSTIRITLGNALGLILGSLVMMLLRFIFPIHQEISAVVVLAAAMAFFILGTVAPLLKLDQPLTS